MITKETKYIALCTGMRVSSTEPVINQVLNSAWEGDFV